MFKNILVPLDGSKLSMKALDTAAGLSQSLGASVTAMTVSPTYPMMVSGDGYMLDLNSPSAWEQATAKQEVKIRADAEKRAESKGFRVKFVAITTDQPYLGIIETAKKQKCDLIVMASHGRRGISALLLGSETTKVLTHSKIPVLVCR